MSRLNQSPQPALGVYGETVHSDLRDGQLLPEPPEEELAVAHEDVLRKQRE